MIRFGACAGIDKLTQVAEVGFSYIELSLATVGGLSEDEFAQYVEVIDASPIKAEAYNGFLPADMKVTGPVVDEARIDAFLELALTRAQRLGGKIVVFGSSGARNLVEGWTEEQAWPQLIAFCRKAGDVAASKGITIVIEPLRKAESNIINTVREGYRLGLDVGHKAVKLLADTYHMAVEGEGLDALVECGDMLRHVHTANPNGRICPKPGDGVDYVSILKTLDKIGYDGRFSIECQMQDHVKEWSVALKMWKEIMGA